jgi:UDP-N-acetylglucosamine--N-acetylmuramyl-(pentapeptide) pyrophosphoryl-undecaprenol N-acetylglucosamine transferase
MMGNKLVLLCAGGTGGHLFPAEALAHELARRGWESHLVTDSRAANFAGRFPGKGVHVVESATMAGRSPRAVAASLVRLVSGYRRSRMLLRELRPALVAGFGGYPTVPPVLAAQFAGLPTLIHEANAILGRANRLLARRATGVAMGFPGPETRADAVVTGNPVRPAILAAAEDPYPERDKREKFNLLVFGGSQGARFFAEIVPKAIGLLSQSDIGRLNIVHQVRAEDLAEVENFYRARKITALTAPFFEDMAAHLAAAHLVVCRAGASTVSELAVVGRPAILVPYPHALDHDQAMNAAAMAGAGGAELVAQEVMTADKLARFLKTAIDDPKKLALMAANAKKSAKADAAVRLADHAEQLLGA